VIISRVLMAAGNTSMAAFRQCRVGREVFAMSRLEAFGIA
jgi:hypothetical protein